MLKKIRLQLLAIAVALLSTTAPADACTGISLTATDNSFILARTIEWAGSEHPSEYVIVPRGYDYTSYTPTGRNGKHFTTKYGMVGIALVQSEFIADGINETGLSAGLFYFPGGYGAYPEYLPARNAETLSDLQVVAWMLSQFSTIDEVKEAIRDVRITSLAENSVVHWRIGEKSGRQVVLEIVEGVPHFYENNVGVITNSPGFEWQVTNLNNYVNLFPGAAVSREHGSTTLRPFGAGSGMLGLPGDFTPPSRFVRAFFYCTSAPQQATGAQCVEQAFQILNNFDIPIGAVVNHGDTPAPMLSSTQWTSATDLTNGRYYYRTMHNSAIRCIDMGAIDFARAKFFKRSIDVDKQTPIENVPTA